jgi:hypothetical protein
LQTWSLDEAAKTEEIHSDSAGCGSPICLQQKRESLKMSEQVEECHNFIRRELGAATEDIEQ